MKIDFRFIIFRFMREQTKKRKNENRLPFYHFSFYAQTIKKRKNENRLPFYQFSFYVQTIQKNGKMKIDFRFIIFRFMCEQSQGFWTGADTTHIVGGGCIRGGGGACAGQKDRGSWRRVCCSRSACGRSIFHQWLWHSRPQLWRFISVLSWFQRRVKIIG